MTDKPLFITPAMEEMTDCFRAPMASRDFTPDGGILRGWPSFHASKADPDGGYRNHTYTVRFFMDQRMDCTLYLEVIASTPRLPDIRISINGREGMLYPYPMPSRDNEIKPAHALHAAIYSKDTLLMPLHKELFAAGENTLAVTAVDDGGFLAVENPQAVLRLDRMASACGFHYGKLALYQGLYYCVQDECHMRPGAVYIKGEGGLVEKCDCVLTPVFMEDVPDSVSGRIALTFEGGSMSVPYAFCRNAFGQYRVPFLLADGQGEVSYTVSGAIKAAGTFLRRRKWKVFTTPHAHTDIGYTHRQWEVAERMSRNLDTALRMMSDEKGDAFSYILDSAWALEDFQETRNAEALSAIISAARNGKLGIPANYVDLLTQFASLEDLIHNGDFTNSLLGPYGLCADRVDMVDVASASGAYPTILAGMGVKYLLHADNQDRGPFRLNGGLHRKSPFWWEGPDGSRVLTWLARMYCELKKVCGSPGSLPAAERGLNMWLMEYEREDYKPDAVILYGQEADNTDLDVRMAAFQRAWGEYAKYPKLIPSNGSSFFEYVLPYSDTFAVFKGDEGAYWEDGAASSLLASIKVRKAQAGLKCAEILESLASLYAPGTRFPQDQYTQAWKQVLLYDEHTWGAFLSGSDPEALLQRDQWQVKEHMAAEAFAWREKLLLRGVTRLSLSWNNQGREAVVYNPYSFPLGGLIEVEFGANETVCTPEGLELPWRKIRETATQVAAEVLIPEIPPLSYRRFPLRPLRAGDTHGQATPLAKDKRILMENEYYMVIIDAEAGFVTSLWDKECGRELCAGGEGIGRMLYTRGGQGTTLLGNHAGLSKTGGITADGFFPKSWHTEETPVGIRAIITGQAVLGGAVITFSLLKGVKRLDICLEYEKQATDAPEAVYVAFPMNAKESAKVFSDSQVGWVDWQEGVLPGGCREWLPLQTSMLVRDNGYDMQIASPDVFLFTVNQPVQGLWKSDLPVRGGRLYSYALNNYWRCNYLGRQGGTFTLRYSITSAPFIPFEKAFAFGWAARQGLYVQRMSYQEFRGTIPEVLADDTGGTLMIADSDHIFVNTLRGTEEENRSLLRLMECGGRAGAITVSLPRCVFYQEADHLGRPLGEKLAAMGETFQTTMSPWQVKSLLLHFS